ncbi:hypothetical protein DC429_09980 [Arthrobacter sp. TPD3018]|uniref:hypothetical protein n=1 Tax=Bacteria TaxID=2 RepID=UPI000D51E67E|nr:MULTISPECIES: hypothetical protein [Bacteria]PVE58181.1 hypothetical protein DC425_08030 [Sphingomonas sp. TPD3009]PVE58696.1 hypothetical protein DC429_09980 [Arthrobacter sp. TPD3018]PVE86268.1 hypothetical protein DC431_09970 [Sphingomonas melonis]
MCTLPGEIVDHIVAQCPGRTDEALQPRFGISYNTWRKIAAGEPIRATVAARLIERIMAEKTRLSQRGSPG